MKNIIILVIGLAFATVVNAQKNNTCDTVYLKTETNIKNAEPCVLVAADYILSKPLQGNTKVYSDYIGFILLWMEKTPDFTFSLNEKMIELSKDDENVLLFGVYISCLAKAGVKSKKDFNSEAIKLFVEYVSNSNNKVKQTSKIKKLIDDYKSNKIEKYIK